MRLWQISLIVLWIGALILIFPGNWVLSFYNLAWETKIMHIGLILLISSPSLFFFLLGKLSWWQTVILAVVPTLVTFILVTILELHLFQTIGIRGLILSAKKVT